MEAVAKKQEEAGAAPTASNGTSSSWEIPTAAADPSFVDGVASKDVVVSGNVWVRLYLPQPGDGADHHVDADDLHNPKLPLLLHVHGGGFVTFSAATISYHHFCKKIAREANVFVVSLNHRLAPEYRLPTAYDDLLSTLEWLHSQAQQCAEEGEPWLLKHANFSRLIFMGGSSGANIVYNTFLHYKLAVKPTVSALKFQAQILLQPFFGGQSRTNSELHLCNGPILTLSKSDELWNLALPLSEPSSRDHPFCNPVMVPAPTVKEACLPKCLVLAGGQDLLHDRQVEFAAFLKTAGVEVYLVDFPEAAHGFVTSAGVVSYVFMPELLKFIHDSR